MTEVNFYKKALHMKLRFSTNIGDLTVEDVMQLPLTKKRGGCIDLDDLAIASSKRLGELGELSFVKRDPDPRKVFEELRFVILKDIIADKMAEEEWAKNQANLKAEEERLLVALAKLDDRDLAEKGRDAVLERLAAVKAARSAPLPEAEKEGAVAKHELS